jgi:hypothetical protein
MGKKILPGDKRNISFPLDIDSTFLDYLNNQKNLSGTIMRLALKGFKTQRMDELEKRIENIETIISNKMLETKKPSHIEQNDDMFNFNYDTFGNSNYLDPEEEDDQF